MGRSIKAGGTLRFNYSTGNPGTKRDGFVVFSKKTGQVVSKRFETRGEANAWARKHLFAARSRFAVRPADPQK